MKPAEHQPGLFTIGHGTDRRGPLGDRLAAAGIDLVVDVRRFPGSRRNPDVSRDALTDWLPRRGIAYRWEERLGGRRHRPVDAPDEDTWWTVPAFRAYAAYTRTAEFGSALDDVLDEVGRRAVAVMCSESVWWRCHRRLIADVVTLSRQTSVRHILPTGRVSPHAPAEGARVRPDGLVVWDARR